MLDRDGRMYVSMYHPAATLHNPAVTSDFVADCEALQRLLSDKHMLQGPRPRRVAGFLIAAVPASRGHGERQFFHI